MSRLLSGMRVSSPPPRYPHLVLILEHSTLLFMVCTGAECRLDKAEYQQWTMKPALTDRLKGFQ